MGEFEDVEEPVVVQPGDTIEVAEDAGDVVDDDSIVINDNSFDSATDESVNVVVNVEVPEAESAIEPAPEVDRLADLEARVAAVESAIVAPDAPLLEELPPESEALGDGSGAEEVVDVTEDAPAETKEEPKKKATKKRRFGR